VPLPGPTLVFPGHGESTTIEREREFNYFLRGYVGRVSWVFLPGCLDGAQNARAHDTRAPITIQWDGMCTKVAP
jgi:hypothetical protein